MFPNMFCFLVFYFYLQTFTEVRLYAEGQLSVCFLSAPLCLVSVPRVFPSHTHTCTVTLPARGLSLALGLDRDMVFLCETVGKANSHPWKFIVLFDVGLASLGQL